MNSFSRDLNSLLVFKVLYEELNLSRAAERLSLSQPALSHRLNKLRSEFNDPLFVRAARGLTATPLAETYAADILAVVGQVEGLYQSLEQNDYLSKADKVSIYATDLVEHMLMAKLLTRTRQEAPSLQIALRNAQGRLPKQELQKGDCDLAIAGFFADVPEGFYQQLLCSHPFVVLAHKHNPHISDKLEINQFVACPQVMITLTGDLYGGIDKTLKSLGLKRNILAGYSGFLTPPALIANQPDLLFTCVKPIADMAVKHYSSLVIHECPVAVPAVDYVQIWHERSHNDPMRKWLRGVIKQVMMTS